MERLLAIDYGRKRIGLAGCDPLGITVQPLEAITGEPRASLARIVEVCGEREIDRIVIGLPLHMDGGESDMAREVRKFGVEVERSCKRPVVYQDERLSSATARAALRGQTPKQKQKMRREGRIDAMAAAEILRDFLVRKERGDG